jgi:outer membrane protein assembly factor BamB
VSKSEIKAAVTCDSNDTAWVGCHDRRVVCFNYSTKDILFQYETGAPIFASVVMDTVNKIVAVASEDGYLYGFNNAPPFGLIWQCNVKSPIFATPVFDPSRECCMGEAGLSVFASFCNC